MEYTLYIKPQLSESKKPKQNRVKSRKNDFVETYLLNLLKSCVLLLQFLKIFLFHCVKSVQIRSFFLSVFSCIQTRKNPVFGHFSRSVFFYDFHYITKLQTEIISCILKNAEAATRGVL